MLCIGHAVAKAEWPPTNEPSDHSASEAVDVYRDSLAVLRMGLEPTRVYAFALAKRPSSWEVGRVLFMPMTEFATGLVPVVRRTPLVVRRPCQRVVNAALKRAQPRELVGHSLYGFDFAGPSSDVIPRHVYVYGVWEPDISAWAAGFVRAGDVVLDVGANIGYFSLLCASRRAAVIAVEASPSVAAILWENVARNGADITIVQAIAGADVGIGQIYLPTGNLGDASTVPGKGMTIEGDVERVLGDSLVSEPPRLIKIDTEGDELNVLRGLPETLAKMEPGSAVLAEVSPDLLAKRGHTAEDVFELMSGFDTYWLPNDYTPARYSSAEVASLAPLTRIPHGATDVVFIKR